MRRNSQGGRRGPGLIGTMARTAVIAGTATAVSNKVSSSANAAAQQQALQQQQQAALQQQQLDAAAQRALANQQAMMPPQPVMQQAPPPAAPAVDRIAQLQQLAALKEQGILSDAEFEAEKARILAS